MLKKKNLLTRIGMLFSLLLVFVLVIGVFNNSVALADDDDGIWVEEGNAKYYYVNGLPYKGILEIDDRVYFLDENTGAMVRGWKFVDGHWRYFRNSGTMVTSRWEWLNGNWKFFNSKGESMDQHWHENGKIWLSQEGPNTKYHRGFKDINGYKRFYRETSGTMAEGFQYINNNWYFLREGSGSMAYGWQYVDGDWYFLRNSGTRVNGFQKIDGKWHQFKSNGRLRDREEILKLALNYANVSRSAVRDLEIELDSDDGRLEYEIEFDANRYEYEFDIDARTERILQYDRQIEDRYKDRRVSGSRISRTQALNVALNHANLSRSSIWDLEIELDEDDGYWEYEIEFKSGRYEYEYDIHAKTRQISEINIEYED